MVIISNQKLTRGDGGVRKLDEWRRKMPMICRDVSDECRWYSKRLSILMVRFNQLVTYETSTPSDGSDRGRPVQKTSLRHVGYTARYLSRKWVGDRSVHRDVRIPPIVLKTIRDRSETLLFCGRRRGQAR